MGKHIKRTALFTIILFILLAVTNYFTKGDDWMKQTISWVVAASVGYFLGGWNVLGKEDEK